MHPPRCPSRPRSLDELRQAAAGCRACDLYERATQTVFGEGRAGAWLMFVGEQPGDREDLTGAPFVGPAGGLLGRSFRVTQQRGQVLPSPLGPPVAATVHPSSILRAADGADRRAAYAAFVDDLRRIAAAVNPDVVASKKTRVD